jgi:hypothetical protein
MSNMLKNLATVRHAINRIRDITKEEDFEDSQVAIRNNCDVAMSVLKELQEDIGV